MQDTFQPIAPRAVPGNTSGAVTWLQTNLFSNATNSVMTLVMLAIVVFAFSSVAGWSVTTMPLAALAAPFAAVHLGWIGGLAGAGAGIWNSVDEACEATIAVGETIEPDAENVSVMNQRHDAYRKIYDAVKPILDMNRS